MDPIRLEQSKKPQRRLTCLIGPYGRFHEIEVGEWKQSSSGSSEETAPIDSPTHDSTEAITVFWKGKVITTSVIRSFQPPLV